MAEAEPAAVSPPPRRPPLLLLQTGPSARGGREAARAAVTVSEHDSMSCIRCGSPAREPFSGAAPSAALTWAMAARESVIAEVRMMVAFADGYVFGTSKHAVNDLGLPNATETVQESGEPLV